MSIGSIIITITWVCPMMFTAQQAESTIVVFISKLTTARVHSPDKKTEGGCFGLDLHRSQFDVLLKQDASNGFSICINQVESDPLSSHATFKRAIPDIILIFLRKRYIMW